MNYFDYSEKLNTIYYLTKTCATGTPKELACRLNVSEKTVRRMINQLRNQGFLIKYCRIKLTYTLT